MKQLAEALVKGGKVAPKFRTITLEPGTMTLDLLLREGIVTPGGSGDGKARVKVEFKQVGEPFTVRERTGWQAVKVKSSFGGLTTLLYVADKAGEVSGVLRLRR